MAKELRPVKDPKETAKEPKSLKVYQNKTESKPVAKKSIRKKKKIKEESEGTEKRREIEYVGRPDSAESPKSVNSKLGRQGQYKTKIIDEAKKMAGIYSVCRVYGVCLLLRLPVWNGSTPSITAVG